MPDKRSGQDYSATSNIVGWAFAILFIVIGILNLFLVHPVPGVFYLVLSLIYIPRVNALLKRKLGFTIPLFAKVILGLVVLWGTLAVGDLAEMAGL